MVGQPDRPGKLEGRGWRLEAGMNRHSQRPELRGLRRKEVIQPQLPLRLPCYDFVPITDPTFGAYLPRGLAQRLQVLPAFMT